MSSPKNVKPVYRFGPYVADVRAGELYKRGKKNKVQQQPMQVLEALLEKAGEVVTREELRAGIWPADTFVDFEHSLNTAIKKLRKALGDNAGRPKYIETLPRRGYRFLGEVEATGEAPRVVARGTSPLAGKMFVLEGEEESECVVAPVDEKCLAEWQRLKQLGDDVGVSILVTEKRLLLLGKASMVRLLSVEGGTGWCEVRILEGEHYGKTALVGRKMLKEEKKKVVGREAKAENRK
jgi:DNA-binding winged helix-turn-helix (wHTH) protein